MKQVTHIILSYDDMFKAFRDYVANNVDGVKAEDVCNFRIQVDPTSASKSTAEVHLTYKDI
jgi:hypothetical protein